MLLEDELKACRCMLDADEFRDLLVDVFHAEYRAWTVDELLIRPDDSRRFANIVRYRAGCQELSDVRILGTLLNIRRRGGRPRRLRDQLLPLSN